MSIIIRLQNLPWEANSLDIRRFFQGLSIPDGGVHIVGGEKGDAFIAFASDEDARQAMGRDGGIVKDARVKLLLSSRNEMQKVIEQARNQTLAIKNAEAPPPAAAPSPGSMHNSGLLPTPLQSGVLGSNIPEPDLRRRGSPERGRRRSRSMERERLRNRTRSRSPNYRNAGPMGRGAHIPMEDGRTRVEPPDLMPPSLNTNNNIGESIPNNYANSNNNLPPVRLRLGGYADSIPQMPYDNSCIPPGLDSDRRIPGHGNKPEPERLPPPNNQPGFLNNQAPPHPGLSVPNMPVRTYSVEMRGLPYNVIPRDIQDFMREVGVYVPEENIKILVDANGYTTGGAVIRLASERECEAGLSLNGRYMGDRRVDVMPLIESVPREQPDLLRAGVANPNVPPANAARTLLPEPIPKRDYVVYMKGIPYNSCTDRDIANFFGPLRIVDIVHETDPSGKPAGNAFVEFASREDYNGALELNLKHMGRRYIEVFPTTREDMNEARRITRGVYGDRNPVGSDMRQTYCIGVTGLPPTVTNRDLTNYFLEVGAQPYAIHIMLKPNGYNAGEAFIEFINPDHHMRALQRDGDTVGSHRISVKAVSFELMRSIVQPNVNSNPVPAPLPALDMPPPPRAGNPIMDPLSDGRSREKVRPMRGGGGGGGGGGPEEYRRKEDRSERRRDPFADPRCVALATNIPYRATIDDICVFFADFGLTQDCVARRFNDKGQPTADCRIAFRTPEEANRAVRQMHKKFLIERPVFLRHAI